jgi:hypothetical protein
MDPIPTIPLLQRKELGTLWKRSWFSPRAGLESVEKRNILCPCRKSKPAVRSYPDSKEMKDVLTITIFSSFKLNVFCTEYSRMISKNGPKRFNLKSASKFSGSPRWESPSDVHE